jgi:hypothetical protein
MTRRYAFWFSLVACLAGVGSSHASSPEAWQALFAEAGKRCAAASGLLDAAALAQPADFGDEVLVLVGGMWPQPHMKKAPAHLLCRFSKTSGAATVIELPADWRAQLR